MKRITSRSQRTLADAVPICGRGLVTGRPIRLRLLPARPDTGLIFHRVDLAHRPTIPALAEGVTGTARRTTIGSPLSQVTLTEHILAALAGMRIDNCILELDGPEPPSIDGSALAFVQAIESVGAVTQSARRPILTPTEPLTVRAGNAAIVLHPSEEPGLKISYLLDYGLGSPIPPQVSTWEIDPQTFRHQLAPCRTFVLDREAQELLRQGVGRHLTHSELLVFDDRGVKGNTLRFADEPARHKILDLVGDLALSGVDLAGHAVAVRSGHPLNVEMSKLIRTRMGVAESFLPQRRAA